MWQPDDGPTENEMTIMQLEADLVMTRDTLKMIRAIAERAPELNLCNYDFEQVVALNEAMVEIYLILNPDDGEQ